MHKIKGHDADQWTERIFYHALFHTFDLAKAKVLDAFARDGELTVKNYLPYLNSGQQIECWEINPVHEAGLRRFTDNVRIGCAYQLLYEAIATGKKYDMVVIDAPQCLHSDFKGNIHAENFDFLCDCFPILNKKAFLVFNMNRRPYNKEEKGSHGYDEYKEYNYSKWMEIRQQFFGFKDDKEEKYLETYREVARYCGYQVKSVLMIPAIPNLDIEPYVSTVALEVEAL